MLRLASFRQISSIESPVSLCSLSEAGFKYSGQGDFIICEGCNKKIPLLTVLTCPSNATYHYPSCQYIAHETQHERGISSVLGASSIAVPANQLHNASITISSEVNTTQEASPENRSSSVAMSTSTETRTVSGHVRNIDIEMAPSPKQTQTNLDESSENRHHNPPSINLVDVSEYRVTGSTNTEPVYVPYNLQQTRLDSFNLWQFSHIISPLSLAEAGFVYTGYADCVRCFQCGLGLRSWKSGDDVYKEHERFRPTCPLLQSLLRGRNTPSDQTVSGNTNQENTVHNEATPLTNVVPGNKEETIDYSQPVCESFISLQSRANSFDSWSYSRVIDTHRLAEAGTFYTGDVDEHLRCFMCGLLWRMKLDGDVYSEHERINPGCPLLRSQLSTRNTAPASGNNQDNVPEIIQDYSHREHRRQSFASWTGPHPLDPELLIEFFYLTAITDEEWLA